MNYESYSDVEISSDKLEYKFVSLGPKGCIHKIIRFQKTNADNILNLVVGNILKDGKIDDCTVSDNKDRNRILATVLQAINDVTIKHAGKDIFFSGTTPERSRLYRMAINLHFEILSSNFNISGVSKDLIEVPFTKDVDYIGFLMKRKAS
jgi:hypothetical protein